MEMLGGLGRNVAGIVCMQTYACGIMLWSGMAYAIRDQVKMQVAMLAPQVFLLLLWWYLSLGPYTAKLLSNSGSQAVLSFQYKTTSSSGRVT